MKADEPGTGAFGPAEQLKLQQLLTLKALAEARSEGGEAPGAAGSAGPGRPSGGWPEKWQLVADGVRLHLWQRTALDKWLERGAGTVKVATGGGKTLFALAAAQALQNSREPDLRLAVVVPTIPLMHQWLDELESAGVPGEYVALMGGGRSVPSDPGIRILLCVINSARDRLAPLVEKFQWAGRLLLVVDECHRANATEARRVFESRPRYTLGLSATPEGEEDDLVPSDEAYARSDVGKALGPIIFDFSLKDSLAAGLLTPFEVWHVALPLAPEEGVEHDKLSREISSLRKDLSGAHRRSRSRQAFIPWCQAKAARDGGSDAARFIALANRRKRLLYGARARRELTLQILAAAMRDEDRRAIVFHESINEIDRLFEEALGRGVPAVLEHSGLPAAVRSGNIDAFRRGIARAIVSAKSLVEGFNVPSADVGIIAASSGSVRQRIQSLGRLLRKKRGGTPAIVFVLYIGDTEDEAIYGKADWEAVTGAERNRYLEWRPAGRDEAPAEPADLETLLGSLVETGAPPRKYRPPCREIDAGSLAPGDEYPAQNRGVGVRVDHAGNLRDDEGGLVTAPARAVEAIVRCNRHRRAVVTPCGHLVVRPDDGAGGERWLYLGMAAAPGDEPAERPERLAVKRVSGRRVIAKAVGRNTAFALGPERASSAEAGAMPARLLNWVDEQSREKRHEMRDIFWDRGSRYWVEFEGRRTEFTGDAVPLEFAK